MRSRLLTTIVVTALLSVVPPAGSNASATALQEDPTPARYDGARTGPDGAFALSGPAARKYVVPTDMVRTQVATLEGGRTSARYQQLVDGSTVLGGQVTVIRSAQGITQAVFGAHFEGLEPANEVNLRRADARRTVERAIGRRGAWTTTLRLDPRGGISFYEVQSSRVGRAPVRWVDAETGEVLRAFDAVRRGEGTGVKNDRKLLRTSGSKGNYLLRTPEGRQVTYDDQNGLAGQVPILMADDNDRWNRSGQWESPDQRAGVDAHYYAGVVDRFFADVFNRNSLDDAGVPLQSVVHVDRNVCNAFWDGTAAYFGDGFQGPEKGPHHRACLPISGALDVVAHEFAHGVTQYTSRLYAGPESTALNEGFSDIMASAVEFYAAAHRLDPAAPADWRFGEDVVAPRSTVPGFRSLADPGEDGSLDHYSEITGSQPVHAVGTIAGHSFFLASTGGRNAGCTATALRPATHTADCDVDVPRLGIDRARHIYYTAFTGLQENAGFCDARNASVAVAGPDAAAVSAAWQAVGVAAGCVPTPPPPPPPAPACLDQPSAQLPFESAHPYADNSDCTWTFDNGSPGFAFHFSDLSVESDYDFVVVRDGDGNVLGVYSGDWGPDAPPTCIPTSTGMVQLFTDSSVVDRGFVVDAVHPC